MSRSNRTSWFKRLLVGKSRSLSDAGLFHKVSLIALLAWVGLGSDGLSSSCYGPEEAFKALGTHPVLSLFVALGTVATIVVICASYSQIIEVFPSGGGGYLVASKLLSPGMGVVSGAALLVDYVLTIAISVASGRDALFSVLPPTWHAWRMPFACAGVLFLTVLNLRGVKESVMVWVPVFCLFLGTHVAALLVGVIGHSGEFSSIMAQTQAELGRASSELGWFGVAALILRAYSLGAGTFTGIEAVSNGLPVLREPRVQTGKRAMLYMGASLAFMVFGLLLSYVLLDVKPVEGKTLNAVLFEQITAGWPGSYGRVFVSVSMFSAALLLFVAAQTGFIDGPRVLANMALDRWFPTRFAAFSDRFVTQNGILLMGGLAMLVLLACGSSVDLLVVLYSINVFITFSLSQLGMVRHWWQERGREPKWLRKLIVNGVGLLTTGFILASLCVVKFTEGGWVTLVVTGTVIAVAVLTRRHYDKTRLELASLDKLVPVFTESSGLSKPTPAANPAGQTAAIFVNGFNGLGIHTLLGVIKMFPNTFQNFVFIQVGVVDAGNFKGAGEIQNLREHIAHETNRYADQMKRLGHHAEAVTVLGHDLVEAATDIATETARRFPNMVLFGGQLVFKRESYLTRLLHNYAVFALQREFFRRGMPFLILPIQI